MIPDTSNPTHFPWSDGCYLVITCDLAWDSGIVWWASKVYICISGRQWLVMVEDVLWFLCRHIFIMLLINDHDFWQQIKQGKWLHSHPLVGFNGFRKLFNIFLKSFVKLKLLLISPIIMDKLISLCWIEKIMIFFLFSFFLL